MNRKKTTSIELSPFQREKLEYYFKFLDPDEDGYLEKNSVERLMNRILDFTGWDEDGVIAKECDEIHRAFFEILFEKAKEEEGSEDRVSLNSWLAMWATMLPGVMGMSDLPVWLRLMPRIMFKVVDRRRQGHLTANDIGVFYKEMAHQPPEKAEQVAKKAYDQMTDCGRYPLDADSYEQLFSNFLIGRTPYGPGRYIFGCFEHKVIPFELIAPAHDDPEESKMKIKKPTGRRPSRTV